MCYFIQNKQGLPGLSKKNIRLQKGKKRTSGCKDSPAYPKRTSIRLLTDALQQVFTPFTSDTSTAITTHVISNMPCLAGRFSQPHLADSTTGLMLLLLNNDPKVRE
jgi:hypothetical protein